MVISYSSVFEPSGLNAQWQTAFEFVLFFLHIPPSNYSKLQPMRALGSSRRTTELPVGTLPSVRPTDSKMVRTLNCCWAPMRNQQSGPDAGLKGAGTSTLREEGKCLKAHGHPPPVPMSNPRHIRQSSPRKDSPCGADAARRGEADFIPRVPLNLFHHVQLLPHQRGDIPRSLKPVSTTRDGAANAMVHWTSPQPLRILLRVVSPDLGRLMSLLRTGPDWAPLA